MSHVALLCINIDMSVKKTKQADTNQMNLAAIHLITSLVLIKAWITAEAAKMSCSPHSANAGTLVLQHKHAMH